MLYWLLLIVEKYMTNKRKYIIAILVVVFILIIVLLKGLFAGNDKIDQVQVESTRGVIGDPIDVMLDFYELWLSAKKSTSTNPFAEGITKSLVLSQEMSDKLSEFEGKLSDSDIDPVLCQTSVPEKLRARPIFKQDALVQMLVLPSNKQSGTQASVTLSAHDGLWEITEIKCGSGESAPEQGEFSFDREGWLLKSVPPPLDSRNWHLVFEEDGIPGHTAPLFFNEQSSCKALDGTESVCVADSFIEAVKVHLQGNMTEVGVDVRRIEFLE